jgi:hypothetical protein
MRCTEARAAMGRFIGEREEAFPDSALRNHLNSCNSCAEYFDQIQRVWQALGDYPSAEPSPDFIVKTKARLQQHSSRPHPKTLWYPVTGWQWMALTACALILCAFLFLRQPSSPLVPQTISSQMDAFDDKLIQEIEQSLSQLDENESLADYDSWSGLYFETSNQESPQPPKTKPAHKGRGPS